MIALFIDVYCFRSSFIKEKIRLRSDYFVTGIYICVLLFECKYADHCQQNQDMNWRQILDENKNEYYFYCSAVNTYQPMLILVLRE